MSEAPSVVIVGGGYVGTYCALELERRLRRGEASVVLVNPAGFMLYQPLLPEVAAGTVEARHVVVPLREVLRRTRVVQGEVVAIDVEGRTVDVRTVAGSVRTIAYDHLVHAIGAVSRLLPIPGLQEHAVGFKDVEEALYLRNHVLARLDAAEATDDHDVRRRALTFVVVGGGYTGVELVAELEGLTTDACRTLATVRRADVRWLLVEATDRILPTVDQPLAGHALDVLRGRGIDVRLETTLEEAADGEVRLSDGEVVATDTLVWVAGVEANPLSADLGLPVDDHGRVPTDACLRVRGIDAVWSAGDCAAVPDPEGGTYPPTAQHAQREGRHLGRNLVAALRGDRLGAFRYRAVGELVTLGRYEAVGEVRGWRLRGALPWALRRAYYLAIVPSSRRRLAILLSWLAAAPFRRDVVHFGRVTDPSQSLERP